MPVIAGQPRGRRRQAGTRERKHVCTCACSLAFAEIHPAIGIAALGACPTRFLSLRVDDQPMHARVLGSKDIAVYSPRHLIITAVDRAMSRMLSLSKTLDATGRQLACICYMTEKYRT